VTAYVIAESTHVDTPEAREYRMLAQESVGRFGGRYLVRGALPDVLEGDWQESKRMVIIEFDSLDQAKRWYNSAEYEYARSTRSDLAGRRMLFVGGIDE
jgi:uncharacterized protein (DUF1330 family)